MDDELLVRVEAQRLGVLLEAGRGDRERVLRVVLSFLTFFSVLCGYFVLRPVRDEIGVRAGVEQAWPLFPADPWVVGSLAEIARRIGPDDVAAVTAEIASLVDAGRYPTPVWG